MRIIILGCGRLGSGLAQTLSRNGHDVTVVDSDPNTFDRLGHAFKGRTIVGVGFDRDVLIQAGIEKADALAAVTPSDEANIVAARLAKQVFRVPRVGARIYDPRNAEIYHRLGIQTISPISIGAHMLANMISSAPMESTNHLGAGQVAIMDFDLPGMLVGRGVSSLSSPGEFQVVAITRSGKTFLPLPGASFQSGDIVHIAVQAASAAQLKSQLGL